MTSRTLALLLLLASCGPRTPAPTTPSPTAAAPDPERVPFNGDLRAAELRELARTIAEAYSHLAAKQAEWRFDLDQLVAKYEPAIRRADTWSRYELVMVSFVCELHDAHLGWRRTRTAGERRRRVARLGLATRFSSDALVVSEVWPGSAVERAGVRRGDRVVAIDGKEVDAAFADYAALRAWSRREAARYDFADEWPARRYDDGTRPAERELTLLRGTGERVTLRIAPETAPPPGRTREAAISVEDRGGVARLRVRSLRDASVSSEQGFGAIARDLYASPRGLVIDLRDNNGGYEHVARAIAGGFSARPLVGATLRVKLSLRARSEHREWRDLVEDPQLPGWSLPQPVRSEPAAPRDYPGRVAVLVDAGCRSSCETLALQLRALGARLFGETTGGSSGAPVTYSMSWSKAQITVPAWSMVDAVGAPVEGHGVVPDETVVASVEDLAAGRDAPFDRAAAWAREAPRK